VPALSRIFGLAALSGQEWVMAIKFAAPILVVEEVLKYVDM